MQFLNEDYEQLQVANYLNGLGLLWCHVPNEGKRHYLTGQKLRLLGLKSGVPDILIFDDPLSVDYKGFKGLAIELKRADGGKLTKNQRKWLSALHDRNWVSAVCHGHRLAIGLIDEVYKKK